MIFESHAHYDDERFDKDRADILGYIGSNGLDVVIIGIMGLRYAA